MSQLKQMETLINQSEQKSDVVAKLAEIYKDFPHFVRKLYADFIESHLRNTEALSGPMFLIKLLALIEEDIKNIIKKSRDHSGYHTDKLLNLYQAKQKLQTFPKDSVLTMIQECLKREQELLAKYKLREPQTRILPQADVYCQDCMEQIKQLDLKWKEIEKLCDSAEDNFKAIHQLEYMYSIQENAFSGQNGDSTELLTKFRDHFQLQKECFSVRIEDIKKQMNEFLPCMDNLLSSVLDLVKQWKNKQKLAYVKAAKKPAIEELKSCCSEYGRLIFTVLHKMTSISFYEILRIPPECSPGPVQDQFVNDVKENMLRLTNTFFEGTFVVVEQPPELLKMQGTKNAGSSVEFSATVCILGAVNQNIESLFSKVEASFLSETEILKGLNKTHQLENNSADLQNAEAVFELLKVKEFSREDSKNTRVWQNRYRLLFTVKLTIRGDLFFTLKTMSLPIASNTGSNQACSALAALTWYCFNVDDVYDLSQSCPAEIPWQKAADMLESCLKSLGGQKVLTEDEKKYLAGKMTGKDIKSNTEANVSFNHFCETNKGKDKNNDRTVVDCAFFRWFLGIRNLISDYLLEPWKNGVIKGFITSSNAKKRIDKEEPGTFLIRFSESYVSGDFQGVTGGIVVVVKTDNKVIETPPRTAENFSTLSLYKVLQRICQKDKTNECLLKQIYPSGIPFEEAFQKYNKCPDLKNSQYQRYRHFMNVLVPNFSSLTISEESHESSMEVTDDVKVEVSQDTEVKTKGKRVKKGRSNMNRHEKPSVPNIPVELMGCCVKPDPGPSNRQQANTLRVPTKASLKRQRLSCDSTSGGTVTSFCESPLSLLIQLPENNEQEKKSLPNFHLLDERHHIVDQPVQDGAIQYNICISDQSAIFLQSQHSPSSDGSNQLSESQSPEDITESIDLREISPSISAHILSQSM